MISRHAHLVRLAAGLGALGAALVLDAGRARAQAPNVPDVRERSGLFTRHTPIIPMLPIDKKRDIYYDTRWEDPRYPWRRGWHVNSFKDGGLYGMPLPAGCTACRSPFFRGSPGAGEVCEPPHKSVRFFSALVHPFRPVGSYYAGGCYVPVYDLDPFVPGPGPYPWSHYCKQHTGG
ncbi:hypothetical protein BH23PLA1_BH23PLA1_23910 [soil metagenome]